MPDYLNTLASALTGRYQVERELGQGGMAIVYLARDVRHDRPVALKVLRPELAAVLGAERFLKEIKTTANLQHPHILPLHDSGEMGGLVYYVMPYVEGESLRDLLNREKQLPIDETLRIAGEVASALDYAHRHGVVHRDIKPENILLHDGRALVADFGIALAASRTDGATRLTETGLSLGTPAYMAPEQAMGERDLTAKADVYALGCVVYEMLVGQPPFTGPNAQAIIAAVLTDEPRGLAVQRHTVPPHVEAAVLRAIEKLPADRFASAQEFADALEDQGRVPARGAGAAAVRELPGRRRPVTWRDALRHPLTLTCAALAVVGLGAAGAAWLARPSTGTDTPVRFALTFGPDDRWVDVTGSAFALSPDGTVLAYVGTTGDGRRELFVRPMADLTAHPLAGTDGARQPFFSPDGQWIGYDNGTQLMKVPVGGGTPVPVAEVPLVAGASWATSDRIVTSTQGRIAVVPATGGEPRIVGQIDSATELVQQWPLALSDGRTALYQSWPSAGLPGARIGVIDLESGASRRLDLLGTQPLAVLDGRLVYASAAGAIMAVAFDARTQHVTGAPMPVVDAVNVGALGVLKGTVSSSGSLAYVGRGGAQQPLVLEAPNGTMQVLIADERGLGFPRFSPDGRHLAVTVTDARSSDVWVYDLPAGPFRRVTTEGTVNDRPEWTPDSREILFRSNRGGGMSGLTVGYSLWTERADGSAPAQRLFALRDAGIYEGVLSADGSYLLFQRDSTGTGGRTWYRRLHGDTSLHVVASAPQGQQTAARLSPDGRWVAYQSDELGSYQVYVKPFPALDARYQVSLELGNQPIWSPDGKRLFYLNGQALIAAALSFSPTFHVTARDTVFADGIDPGFPYHANYDISPDGKRFAFVKAANIGAPVIVVHNWKVELDARTAPKSR
jgi:Tol biopolymer transport system component/predicted Ser/Thr protein kinase